MMLMPFISLSIILYPLCSSRAGREAAGKGGGRVRLRHLTAIATSRKGLYLSSARLSTVCLCGVLPPHAFLDASLLLSVEYDQVGRTRRGHKVYLGLFPLRVFFSFGCTTYIILYVCECFLVPSILDVSL